MRTKGPEGQWYIGPFATEIEAEAFEARLVELVSAHEMASAGGPTDAVAAALARVILGGLRLIDTTKGPGVLLRAADAALGDLKGKPGQYQLTVNVGPDGFHEAVYAPPPKHFR